MRKALIITGGVLASLIGPSLGIFANETHYNPLIPLALFLSLLGLAMMAMGARRSS